MEGEGDDLCGNFFREAREALRSPRHEGLPVGLLVRREAAGCDLAQVGVGSVGRDRGASGQQDRVYAALLRPVNSAPQRGKVVVIRKPMSRSVARFCEVALRNVYYLELRRDRACTNSAHRASTAAPNTRRTF